MNFSSDETSLAVASEVFYFLEINMPFDADIPPEPDLGALYAKLLAFHQAGDVDAASAVLSAYEACHGPVPDDPDPSTTKTVEAPGAHAEPAVSGLPPISAMTMLQTTLWDNWGSPERPKPTGNRKGDRKPPFQRYGAEVEVWTVDPTVIRRLADMRLSVAYKATTRLILHRDLPPVLARLVAEGRITPAYERNLLDLRAESTGACGFGLFRTRTRQGGSPYAPRSFIRVEVLGGVPVSADLWSGGEGLRIVGWTASTPSQEPLTAGVVRQSRLDLSGEFRFLGKTRQQWDSRA